MRAATYNGFWRYMEKKKSKQTTIRNGLYTKQSYSLSLSLSLYFFFFFLAEKKKTV